MKGLVYHGPEQLSYEEVADISPGSGEVKIRVKAVGICGSDLHGYLGITGRRIPPVIMGHEFSGIVEEVGSGVTGFRPGDRVAPFPVIFCGRCGPCKRGDVHLCEKRRLFGVLTENGAMADFICAPANGCFRLEDKVSFETGSLMEPLAVSYRAVGRISRGQIEGANVFLVGAGTIGLLTLACAKLLNPARIIVSDLSDIRLEIAKCLGATHVVNPAKASAVEEVKRLTGGAGADVAFEAVGATPTVQQAMGGLRQGGTAVWIGNNKPMIEINMQEIVTRELAVFGTYLYNFADFTKAVELLNSGTIEAGPIVSKTAPMREGAAMFAKMAKDPGDLIKVVLVN
ncbi:MAG: alcohol dehydrogenase catalytic domain-containing protein [Planctomycetes bacterium]|nr:alcohol dehydrogenase catalytic domain-containing protein [Planctomycetota bacterium]